MRRLLTAVLALPAAAALVVAIGSARTDDGEEFQRLVGGVGLGPAVDLSRCAREFDPRLQSTCSWRHEPVPGGSLFCPSHAGSPR